MHDTKHVKGLAELGRFLQQFPAKMERNILRGALRAGAKPVQQQAKADVPKDTGQLAAGIKIQTDGRRRGVVIAKVKLTGPHAFVGPWIEYGTDAHRIVPKNGGFLFFGGEFAKAIDHPGIAPRPFLLPALMQQRTQAVMAVATYIKNRLQDKHGLDTSDIAIEADE